MKTIPVPPAIELAATLGATFYVSISGGKDSQEIFRQVTAWHQAGGYPGAVMAIHADLGRADWPQSLSQCQHMTQGAGIPLLTVQRTDGADLVEHIKRRMAKLAGTGTPFWPSSSNRFCTSDLKRDPIDKKYRENDLGLLVSVEGIRAEESPARAKKPPLEVRSRITTKVLKKESPSRAVGLWEPGAGRLALTWNPILEFSEEDVYQGAGHSLAERNQRRAWYKEGKIEQALAGWLMHPAYVFGSNRVSCMVCILASVNDLRVGALHGAELYRTYRGWEVESGFTFKSKWSLGELEK